MPRKRLKPLHLIRINDHLGMSAIIAQVSWRSVTPFDAVVVGLVVVDIFVAFAGVVAWGGYQTRPERLNPPSGRR
jgi:hypothetical protein